jgi:protein TonB
MKNAPNKKYQERASAQPNKWQDQQQYRPNQTYSTAGQAASSPMYQLPGGGGVGAGTTNPFGDQYGAYANLLYQRFAQSWHTQDVDARVTSAPPVLITFAMLRDGSLVPGSVRVVQSSGNSAIDRSAQRAVYDAADTRLPPLPPGLNRDRVDVNLRFELRR